MLAVTEGFVGLGVFLAIVMGTAVRLLRMISQPIGHEDRMLAFAHLAVLIGLMTTLTTVFLGEQVVMLFFLFVGWVQAMRPVLERRAGRESARAAAGFPARAGLKAHLTLYLPAMAEMRIEVRRAQRHWKFARDE